MATLPPCQLEKESAKIIVFQRLSLFRFCTAEVGDIQSSPKALKETNDIARLPSRKIDIANK
jgi:hypothetical protein